MEPVESKEKDRANVYLSGSVVDDLRNLQRTLHFPSLSYTVRYVLAQMFESKSIERSLE